MAGDTGSAMLRSKGGVWVNGTQARDSTAVFSGDVIETKSGFVANLDAEGSSVLIQSESIVSLGDNELTLDHGSVSVGSSTGMRVKVNCLTVIPVVNQWTQYDVTDVNGTVHVVAHKMDVNITQGGAERKHSTNNDAQSASLHEGQESSRDESQLCAAAKSPGPAGGGTPISTTRWIEIGGGGVGAAVLCLLLCRGTSSTSVSTSQP
ncbi:MAG TPA: hypothetical protein VI386_18745 [Candidatus Sulfotelmatobacter sp.]